MIAEGNTYRQPTLDSGWTSFNLSDNVIFLGGKGTSVNIKNNLFVGFKNGYRINYSNPKTRYNFENKRVSCGNTTDPYNTSLFTQMLIPLGQLCKPRKSTLMIILKIVLMGLGRILTSNTV